MSDDEYSDDGSVGSNDSLEEENKKEIFSKNSSLKPNLPSFVKKTNLEILNEEDDEVEEEDEEEDPDFIDKNDILEEEDEDEDTDDDLDDDDEIDENGEENDYETKKTKNNKKINFAQNPNSNTVLENNIQKNNILPEIDSDEEDENDNYLQKFSLDINQNYLMNYHPETVIHNYDEISVLTKIIKDRNGTIIDPLHRTASYLTKYEKARVLGQRAKQIECGAKPFIKVPENIIESYIIAELELKEKKIPFIIRRPLSNGTCEYWNLRDLDIIAF